MYFQNDVVHTFSSRSLGDTMRDSSGHHLRGSVAAIRTRFQLDVVLEHVHVSHHVQLTDKELRITFQRDSKSINSDPAIWRDCQAEFRQVVGLQSTLTRIDRSSTGSYEPKLYHFIVTSLPSQTEVAAFELDIALYLNKTLTLSLPALASSKDPTARLSLNLKCHAVDRTQNKKQRADTSTVSEFRASSRHHDMLGRHSKAPASLVRSSTLTDSSSTMQTGGIQDTISEYSDDGHASVERLTKQLEAQQRKNKKLQASLSVAEKKIDSMKFELDEMQVREEGETQHGLQLRTWNMTLLQEFEILKLQLIQNAMATEGSLEPAYDHIDDIDKLTRDAYVFEPETTMDEILPADSDDDDDDSESIGSSNHHDIDSNFNFDPDVEWTGETPKNDTVLLEEKSFTTLANDIPILSPVALEERGNQLLIEELHLILKRNQRLQQTIEFLLIALQPPTAPSMESSVIPVTLQPIPSTPTLSPSGIHKGFDEVILSQDIDLNSRLLNLQAENDRLLNEREQFQKQLSLQQGLNRLNSVVLERNDLLSRVNELESSLAHSNDQLLMLQEDLLQTQLQSQSRAKRIAEFERSGPRSEMATESAKHMQTLKQENLAMKFRLTTLEHFQEKYETAEKERKRLVMRLQQYDHMDDVPDYTPAGRSRNNTMDKTHENVDSLTRQRVAAMDMQINVLNELQRTQTMQIQHMEEDYNRLRTEFTEHLSAMQQAMAKLAKEYDTLKTEHGRMVAMQAIASR
ncbi:hypothetical protein THRCLA_00891 [Thraustotheca clavata]|uniref:C2 NT-type domain-containing protein n=1 Tax=Thraustotheca clavata TaxID=74557 RepID=A0A1W0A9V8_9STRA|nr:hypothetical protein THRCLA_00891 [Thraustotheca clavata]